MGQRKSINERKLTRKQVRALLDQGAQFRPDLSKLFERNEPSGTVDRPRVYELTEDRFLFVFDEDSPYVPGQGDIYQGAYFRAWAEWYKRSCADELHGLSSVEHWRHFSKMRDQLPSSVDALIKELATITDVPMADLDLTYASLDTISRHIDLIGRDLACATLYDHLVAYLGKVIAVRTNGAWKVDPNEVYPYIAAAKHAVMMPINAVWEELIGFEEVNLRQAATNEVRSARSKH